MQFGVCGVAFSKVTALLSIVPAIFVAGCMTTASPPVTATNPHPDLPANYRKQIAEYMRTQMFARMGGIKGAEISEPHRGFAGLINGGERDTVCVRFGGGGWPNFSVVRGYTFVGGKLNWDNGGIVSEYGRGVLTEAMACGENPTFKPFPEADWQPPRT
jgi:NADPH-dependent 2,4-dienoyl-CoA reductase/sulfur reductase-like enzyme